MSAFTTIPFNTLSYLHPTDLDPPSISEGGGKCIIKTAKNTDWWHTLDRDSQDGLAWGKWVDIGEGLEVQVKASIDNINRVTCLFFYIGPHTWIKAGVEFDMGKLFDGAVVCNKYSDWAITPAKSGVTYTIAYNPQTQHIRIFLDDVMIREVHGFASTTKEGKGEGEKEGQVFIGVMGCSPLGEGSLAHFERLEWKQGVRDVI